MPLIRQDAIDAMKARDAVPVKLKPKLSFGESLRAKFGLLESESDDTEETQKTPSEPDSEPEREYEIEEKPSYLIPDQREPRTPMGLASTHFKEEPEYVPGTVGNLWRPIRGKKHAEKVQERGGKYGQGKAFSREVEPLAESRIEELKSQVHVKPLERPISPQKAEYKAKFYARMIDLGLRKEEPPKEEYPYIPMEPIIRTTTPERLGPMIEEIRNIVRADILDEKAAFVVAEGTGEEDLPSPSDFDDGTAMFAEVGSAPFSRLRSTKSMSNLNTTSEDSVKAEKSAKKLAKEKKAKKSTSSGITTADISSPVLVSLPEWEEELEATLSKDYTRKYLLEKARAEKYDLNPPQGAPVDKTVPKRKLRAMKIASTLEVVNEENERASWGLLGNGKAAAILPAAILPASVYRGMSVAGSVADEDLERPKTPKKVRIISQATMKIDREFEDPRATPKPPTRPYRPQRVDSIFPPRPPPKSEMDKKNPVEAVKNKSDGSEKEGNDTRHSAFYG